MVFIKSEFHDDPMPLFDFHLTSTVLELKTKLVHHWCWLKYFTYQLHFSKTTLEDDGTLGHYGITDQSVVHLEITSPNDTPQGTQS